MITKEIRHFHLFCGLGAAHVNAEAYYRAANPSAVLSLIAERDALLEALQAMVDEYAIRDRLRGSIAPIEDQDVKAVAKAMAAIAQCEGEKG